MPLPYLLTRPCYCGTQRDGHGTCPHCDHRQPENHSATPCHACDRLRRRCTTCGTVYGSPAAANACENNDRAQETRGRR
jgi:hypothetical protein